jgi:DNA invertase Pin-like site-specific DNA recombinase
MDAKKRYISYYRVSTSKQGESGLGLEAQRTAVARFLSSQNAGDDQPIAEFTEIESGKRSKNRPQLLAALDLCRTQKAMLVIAKLDRLARNVHFISGLMQNKVEFVAVDMPQANNLTIHILAAVAEDEALRISARTKAALEAAKARGTRLGNPRWQESIQAARQAHNAGVVAPELLAMVREDRAKGMTLRAIADRLNALGLHTAKGSNWYASTVRAVLA